MLSQYPTVRTVAATIGRRMYELIPEGLSVAVAPMIDMVVVANLSKSPWPPNYPDEWENWATPNEAADFLFATRSVTVAAHDEPDVQIRTVRFAELAAYPHTALWLPRQRFIQFYEELERLARIVDMTIGYMLGHPLDLLLREQLPVIAAQHGSDSNFARAVASLGYGTTQQ